MKKLFFLLLSITCVSLEATHFQTSMSVTPLSNQDEFLVEMQIEKIHAEGTPSELIASPKLICVRGEPSELNIESEDKSDLLSIRVLASEKISQKGIQASVLMKEKGLIVLSFNNTIKL